GLWLFSYHRALAAQPISDKEESSSDLVAPVCNLLAYLLGPATLLAPSWFSVGLAVTAVLLVGARERLHAFAYRVPGREIFALGQFLILSGIVLPLLPDTPVTSWTAITPYQVWLALALLLRGGIQNVAATTMAGADRPGNPLELSAAALFALSFVIVSLASSWAQANIGAGGLLWLAGIVGVTDIDPFVLNLAQGGLGEADRQILVIAVLIAASSNNLLKAAYA